MNALWTTRQEYAQFIRAVVRDTMADFINLSSVVKSDWETNRHTLLIKDEVQSRLWAIIDTLSCSDETAAKILECTTHADVRDAYAHFDQTTVECSSLNRRAREVLSYDIWSEWHGTRITDISTHLIFNKTVFYSKLQALMQRQRKLGAYPQIYFMGMPLQCKLDRDPAWIADSAHEISTSTGLTQYKMYDVNSVESLNHVWMRWRQWVKNNDKFPHTNHTNGIVIPSQLDVMQEQVRMYENPLARTMAVSPTWYVRAGNLFYKTGDGVGTDENMEPSFFKEAAWMAICASRV